MDIRQMPRKSVLLGGVILAMTGEEDERQG